MYSEAVVARRMSSMASAIRAGGNPTFTFKDFSLAEVDEWVARLDALYNPADDTFTRTPAGDEEAFIQHELARCKVDFRYWLERYAKITNKKAELVRVIPTHVQNLFLQRVAAEEDRAVSGESGDGILLACLKARQLGISTISECLLTHRVFFYSHVTGIIASDVEEHTMNLYEMVARLLDASPWWLRPRSADAKKDYRAKNTLIAFADQDSKLRFSSGKNMQGGQGEEKGSIGTGSTPHLAHISEFALWPNAEQVFDSLIPAIPATPRTLVVLESTAKGRGNQWHETWERSTLGLGRFKPVFFPYYTDPNDYRLPAPSDWAPNDHTIQHAERVWATSDKWCGQPVRLTRDQMYWYEGKYNEYRHARLLHKLYAEYASDPDEAFQSGVVGPFPPELIADIRMRATQQPIIVNLTPRTGIHA